MEGAMDPGIVRGSSQRTDGGPETLKMPAFADKLTDSELAHVLTFIRNTWGNAAEPVTAHDVSAVRHALHK
jgi:mono/diheme cytochrome c family protein